tara:strand:- start:11650 stop:11793 length:144 start_codon:yes stop_codon:yes gene_type:complete
MKIVTIKTNGNSFLGTVRYVRAYEKLAENVANIPVEEIEKLNEKYQS